MEVNKMPNVAIVGSGTECTSMMNMIFASMLKELQMHIIGVASLNPEDVGFRFAREKGIYTTQDYRDLYELPDLDIIIELTGKDEVVNEIIQTKPPHVRVIDHVAARLFWDIMQIWGKSIKEQEHTQMALLAAEGKDEEKHFISVENSMTGIYIHQDESIVYANKKFADIYGYSREELEGMRILELVHPADRDLVEEIKTKRLSGEDAPTDYEARGLKKDGETIWVLRRNTATSYLGRPAILGNIVDITEQKSADRKLRESEERYRTVLEASPDPVVVYNMEGKCTYVNPAFTKVFGWTPEESLGKKLEYVPAESWPETQKMIDKVLAGKSFSGIESRRLTKGEDILDVSISAAIYLNSNGDPVGSIHTLRDISRHKQMEEKLEKYRQELEMRVEKRTSELKATNVLLQQEISERKRAEQEILKSKAMLQSIFDGISDPLVMLNRNLTVVMLNKPALKYYKVELDDVSGKFCFKALQGKSEPCKGCKIPSTFLRDRPVTFERQGLMDPNRLEQIFIYPVHEEEGEAGSVIVRISDITEARFMERQLIRSEKLASLGLLVAGVAHEINNPQAIIKEKAGLMKDLLKYGGEEFEYREKFFDILDSIYNSVDRTRAITQRLLGFSRKVDVKIQTIQLNQLIEEVLAFLEKEALYRHINLNLDFAPDIPPLLSERGQLQQVFLNIINNAFEAVKDGGTITIATRQKDPDRLQVSITDNGRGISPEQIEHLFEPFYTSGKASGTGLGLFITHGIVTKNLKGSIEVESKEGEGTTFTLEFPEDAKLSESTQQ
jgi:PAS domain S-box-containing protein